MRGETSGEVFSGHVVSFCEGRRYLLSALVAVLLLAPTALGQIYQWEYVDPSDPSKGKKQGTMFTPDGAGPNPTIIGKNHTKAYLPGSAFIGMRGVALTGTIFDEAYLAGSDFTRLRNGNWSGRYADFTGSSFLSAALGDSDFTGANFTGVDLRGATIGQATVTDAVFTDANIEGADLGYATQHGFTASQLYQTASYKQKVLGTIDVNFNDLRGWNFAGQQMADSSFYGTLLDGADFTDALVGPATFVESNLSAEQLYSTADYKAGVLDGIELGRSDMSGFNFDGQSLVSARIVDGNLSNASFEGANLTQATLGGIQNQFNEDVSFRGANMDRVRFDSGTKWRRADLTGAILTNTQLGGFAESTFDDALITDSTIGFSAIGFTTANFLSTANYKSGNLADIDLEDADFRGVDFRGMDLSRNRWVDVNFDGADLRDITAYDSYLHGSMDGADLRGVDLKQTNIVWTGAPHVNLRGAKLTGARFSNSIFTNADITDAVAYGADFTSDGNPIGLRPEQLYSTASYKARNLGPIRLRGDMTGWDFHDQDMTGAFFLGQLVGANWAGAILHDAHIDGTLPNADFRTTHLRGARLGGNLVDSDFRGVDASQVRFSGGSLVGARFDGANLQSASISSIEIENVSFRNADMRGARFNNIDSFTGVDFTGADIRGAGFSALTYDGLTLQQIAVTRSYQEKDLSGVNFAHNEWPGSDWSDFRLLGSDFNRGLWEGSNFSRADLTGADFEYARITGANFTDAIVRQTSFRGTGQYGFTRQMLESTASYKNRDLFGINLEGITMDFWDFRAQDLRGADLRHSSMRGALMDLADLRSAFMPPSYGPNDNPQPNDIPNADLSRTIRRTGRLDLLRVDPGEVLTIRNAVDMNGLPTPANIQLGVAVFNGGGTLRFLLSEDPWKSALVVPSNRPEYLLSDTLELGFDRDTDPYALLDKPIQLILWPRSVRTGEFNVVSDPKYTWDLSALYTQGTVRLVGIVPEPATVASTLLLTAFAGGWLIRRRRQ